MPLAKLMMWKKTAMECGYGINVKHIIHENSVLLKKKHISLATKLLSSLKRHLLNSVAGIQYF